MEILCGVIQGAKLGASTGLDGIFEIVSVEEDVYKIKFSYVGYETYIKPDVRVIRGKSSYIGEIELDKNAIEGEEVTVTAGALQENPE